jgi:ribonuclease HI
MLPSILSHFVPLASRPLSALAPAFIPSLPPSSPPPSAPLHNFITTPPVFSWNSNGLSLYASPVDARALALRASKLRKLSQRLSDHKVIFAQECKFFANETNSNSHLIGAFQRHSVFISAFPGNLGKVVENRAGVLMAIHSSISADFSLSEVPLGAICGGHAVAVRATALDPASHSDFLLVNVYLPCDTPHKRLVLEDLTARLPPGLPSLLGGDLNLTFAPDDSLSGKVSVSDVQDQWDRLSISLGLSMITPDSFTFFRDGKASKLDRFFVSLPESLYATHTPYCEAIAPVGASSPRNGDHLPVSLTFTPLASGARRAFPRIPPELASTDEFTSTLRYLWQDAAPQLPGNPFARLNFFKRLAQETSNFLISKSKFGGSLACSISAASRILAILTSPSPDVVRVTSIITSLGATPYPLPSLSFSAVGIPIQKPFHDFLNGHYSSTGSPCPSPEASTPPRPPRPHLPPPFFFPPPPPGVGGEKGGRGGGGRGVGGSNPPSGPAPPPAARPFLPSPLPFAAPPPVPPPPAAFVSPSRPRPSFLKEAKRLLPSTRKRLCALRAAPGGALTSDPAEMGALIDKAWGEVWSAQPRDDFPLEEEMEEYHATIDASLIRDPTLEGVTRAILESGDSSVGPDGIPFCLYRLLLEITSPLLFDVLMSLAKGYRPPDYFNLGFLHLLPKKETGLPLDTRPITVNNADNRIVASAALGCVIGAVSSFIGADQKLFLPGRHMTDHVRDINSHYYSSLSKQQQLYVLFLDTAKAFDSIHHDYLIQVLRKQGFPPWFINCVLGLLTDAMVSPFLANDNFLRIPILRGVKQGCPLSPILFILCFDPLLCAVRVVRGVLLTAAAADDLAVVTRDFSTIIAIMHIITHFSLLSGLGINTDKSALLPTIPDSSTHTPIQTLISSSPWKDLLLVDQYLHLGVLVGHGVTLAQQFAVPHAKAMGRLRSYIPSLRRMPIHRRSTIINVFIISIYMYLGDFFIIPEYYCSPLRELIRITVIPWHGGGFSASLLYSHHPLGIHPSVRCLWSWNRATLISRIPRDAWPTLLPFQERIEEEEMRISRHAQIALSDYLWGCPTIGQHPATHQPTPRQYVLSKQLIYATHITTYYSHTAHSKWLARVNTKLGCPRGTTEALSSLTTNYSSISSRVPTFMHNNFIAFLNNAIFTKTRWRHTLPGLSAPKSIASHPCSLCNNGLDEVLHYFNDCTVVAEAVALLSPFACISFRGLYLQGTALPALAELTVALCQGIFITRQMTAAGFASADPSLRARRLALQTEHLRGRYFPPRPPPKQRRVVPVAVKAALNAIPASAITAYTDGSSFGNPGPSGAGAFILIPGLRGPEEFHLYEPLGHGTNNLGELWALAMALQFLTRRPLPPDQRIFLISDSLVALAIPRTGRGAKDYPGISQIILRCFRLIADRTTLLWVPGHADIPGNEMADTLAKKGSRISAVSGPALPVFINDCTYHTTFLPPAPVSF